MNAEFYLFDVGQGQCAALRLPNGRWCIFDVGCTSAFSPVQWIANRNSPLTLTLLTSPPGYRTFRFLKATISHWHGDHLADWQNMAGYSPEFIHTVMPDSNYLKDCVDSNSSQSWPIVNDVASYFEGCRPAFSSPDYAGAVIREMCLPVDVARQLGGDANARVNNTSVVTRIDINGYSILLCGDMMKEAWDAIIADQGQYGSVWRPFLSNIDNLVAPHHGHSSGYSVELLRLAKPAVVLVSAVTKDPNVDSRYSLTPVRGMRIGDTNYSYISTRQKGHIKVTIQPQNSTATKLYGPDTYWTFGGQALL